MSLLARLLSKRTLDVIGIMSGTSLDGLDIVLCRITAFKRSYQIKVRNTAYASYPDRLRKSLFRLVSADSISKNNLAVLETELGHFYCKKITSFISAKKIKKVDLIGSHGQTIYHQDRREAKSKNKFSRSWQIVDGDQIAAGTGIPVVSDFRRKDIALGGSGAPLTPACHCHLFADKRENRAVLNIGGITNLTYLPKEGWINVIRASDCGPGNMLVDQLMQRLYKKKYDAGGRKALSGNVSSMLLKKLTLQSWFKKPYPKSLGREQFGSEMVQRIVQSGKKLKLSKADIMATASELTVQSVVRYLRDFPPPSKLIVAGGGVHNKYFTRRLSGMLPGCQVLRSYDMGIDPDYVEAVCFALMAVMFMKGDPACLPHVTGAARPTILGKLSLP